MLTPEEHEIYSRHLQLDEIGIDGQLKLKNARVLVIGAGGLGCPVLQYLTAAGIGTIGIVDHDVVDKSNLQRQILYGHSSLGKPKVEEAKKRLNDLNPFVQINVFKTAVNTENILEIINDYTIVVDCTDNYEARYLINDACVLKGKTVVYGAIHKFEGQVSVFNFNEGPTYRCLYPEFPKQESTASCSEIGVMGVLPGIIGTLQANEVIKLITEIGKPLSGKILLFSALSNQFTGFTIVKSNSEFYDKLMQNGELNTSDYEMNCSPVLSSEIALEDFLKTKNDYEQIIDVREYNEYPLIENLATIVIPIGEIDQRFAEIDPLKKTILFCKRGIRSRAAMEFLQEKYGYKNLHNLSTGILSYPANSNEIDTAEKIN